MKNPNNSTATQVVCAILFLAFTFSFLYYYEDDMLIIEQHIASGGRTKYEPLIGAVLLTLTLFLLQVLITALTKLRGIFHAITYFPSLIILTLLTSSSTERLLEPGLGNWVWQLPVLLVLWGIAALMARRYQNVESSTRGSGLLSQLTFINILTLTALMLIPALMGNHDRMFQQRIHQEYLLKHGQYAEALAIGKSISAHKIDFETDEGKELWTNNNQAIANIYSLFKQKTLGDSLFTLSLPEKFDSIFPGEINGHFFMIADSIVQKEGSHNRDALLSGWLLRRNLPAFAYRLQKWYPDTSNTLPRHYREAVALCRETHPNSVINIQREAMDTTLMDFQRLRQSGNNDSLRMKYRNTYWFYFYRQK